MSIPVSVRPPRFRDAAGWFATYDAASGGNIVNQVQRTFNGLGQLTAEYQSHSGAVNVNSTPKVQYAYSEMSGGANHSRLTSMTYPVARRPPRNPCPEAPPRFSTRNSRFQNR